jgi:hypothetical protein
MWIGQGRDEEGVLRLDLWAAPAVKRGNRGIARMFNKPHVLNEAATIRKERP